MTARFAPEESTSEESTGKDALRRRLRTELARLDPDATADAARAMAHRVLDLPEVRTAHGVMVCLSFGVELDTGPLVDGLLAAEKTVFVPRIERKGRRLTLHPYPCPLETLRFGLQQPTPDAPALAAYAIDHSIDVALLLGLGFTRSGWRLGHGGGYFDRFLVDRPFPAIGLAHGAQILDHLDVEDHDIPMDAVVTESRVHRR